MANPKFNTDGGSPNNYAANELASSPIRRLNTKYVDALNCRFDLYSRNGMPLCGRDNNPLPSLYFRVNPSNLSRPYKKIRNVEMTMGGYAESFGGDDVDTLSVRGVSGAMYMPQYGLVDLAALYGNGQRSETAAYKFLHGLLELFRSNANSYDSRGMIFDTGFVVMSYDVGIYKGLFESLTITETADAPYSHEYDFSFVVEETIYRFPKRISQSYQHYGHKR